METGTTKQKRKQSQAQLANIEPYKFKKGELPTLSTGGGRKPNRVKDLLKVILSVPRLKKIENLSAEEIHTIEKAVMFCTLDDLKKVMKHKDVPAYFKTLINAAFNDIQNGKTVTMDKLRDRQYGPVTTKQDVTSNGETIQGGIQVEIIDRREQVINADAEEVG